MVWDHGLQTSYLASQVYVKIQGPVSKHIMSGILPTQNHY